jgi:hypothetical protein
MDYGEVRKGQAFLILVDSYSKYLDATWIGLTASALVSYLRIVFRHFGPPEVLVSDNGTQFTSTEFASLCEEFNITHLRCAPRMPQSNGQAERMIHTIKNSLDVCATTLDVAIAAYNYTPNSAIGERTPAEVFLGRTIRTPLDVYRPLEKAADLTEYQRQMKLQFDKHHGARASNFVVGEEVSIELANGSRVTGVIDSFIGRAMVQVRVQESLFTRHLNQLWKRVVREPELYPADLEAEELLPSVPETSSSFILSEPPVPLSSNHEPRSVLSEPSVPLSSDHEPSSVTQIEPADASPREIPAHCRPSLPRACKKAMDYRVIGGAPQRAKKQS